MYLTVVHHSSPYIYHKRHRIREILFPKLCHVVTKVSIRLQEIVLLDVKLVLLVPSTQLKRLRPVRNVPVERTTILESLARVAQQAHTNLCWVQSLSVIVY